MNERRVPCGRTGRKDGRTALRRPHYSCGNFVGTSSTAIGKRGTAIRRIEAQQSGDDIFVRAVVDSVEAALAEFGKLDILINNAGAGKWLPLIETTAEEALHMIETHPNIGLVLNKSRERPRGAYQYGYYGADY